MKNLDPSAMENWQIAEQAESEMKPIEEAGQKMGLLPSEIIPMGKNVAKIDYAKILSRLTSSPTAKYIDVTAITPTPLGEGKTTTTIGLVDGLNFLGKKTSGALRQPSGGPTFNIKGSAAGGGLSQCIPMAPLSLRLTGDIDSVTNANNLAMVALTARMQHEHNYDDAHLAQLGLRRLDIDPKRIQMKWAMDFCAQALRHITIGKGGPKNGIEMESGFQISVSSELMAILSVATSLQDLRSRTAQIVVAYDKRGKEITTADLEVDGALSAWLVDALQPNLLQSIEGNPLLIHGGPFANIALGQSSILADLIGCRTSEYHVTESGFGSDIGFEKFWNVKCRLSGLVPHAVVIVATIRALKMHGGGPIVKPGATLDETYTKENLPLLEKGCENLCAHIEIVKKSGISPIICINPFFTDTKDEIRLVRSFAEKQGALTALSAHYLYGGKGAQELAEAVIESCRHPATFHFLYDHRTPLRNKIETIAKEIYGAAGISFSPLALEKLASLESDPASAHLDVCMAKTHLSLSHNPELKGRPSGWTLPIQDFLIYKGAQFIVPITGAIQLMPGTGSNPAFRRIDIDVQTGKVHGLF